MKKHLLLFFCTLTALSQFSCSSSTRVGGHQANPVTWEIKSLRSGCLPYSNSDANCSFSYEYENPHFKFSYNTSQEDYTKLLQCDNAVDISLSSLLQCLKKSAPSIIICRSPQLSTIDEKIDINDINNLNEKEINCYNEDKLPIAITEESKPFFIINPSEKKPVTINEILLANKDKRDEDLGFEIQYADYHPLPIRLMDIYQSYPFNINIINKNANKEETSFSIRYDFIDDNNLPVDAEKNFNIKKQLPD